jgi:hypothetical protein
LLFGETVGWLEGFATLAEQMLTQLVNVAMLLVCSWIYGVVDLYGKRTYNVSGWSKAIRSPLTLAEDLHGHVTATHSRHLEFQTNPKLRHNPGLQHDALTIHQQAQRQLLYNFAQPTALHLGMSGQQHTVSAQKATAIP